MLTCVEFQVPTLFVFDPSDCVFHTGLIRICVQREQPLSSTPIGLAYTKLKTIKSSVKPFPRWCTQMLASYVTDSFLAFTVNSKRWF